MKTRIYILDSGTLEISGSSAFWNVGGPERFRIPCYSVLIKHPDGLLLFDSGFDYQYTLSEFPHAKPFQSPHQSLPTQLRQAGISPRDVDLVVNSHLHFDHCGGNRHLPDAVVLCHERELTAALDPHVFEQGSYKDLSFLDSREQRSLNATSNIEWKDRNIGPGEPSGLSSVLTCASDFEVAHGVWLLESPGHTAGHCSLMVELSDRKPAIFTGDAIYGQRNLDLMCISSFHLDPIAATASMVRLQELSQNQEGELFFSHDPAQYQGYRLSPCQREADAAYKNV